MGINTIVASPLVCMNCKAEGDSVGGHMLSIWAILDPEERHVISILETWGSVEKFPSANHRDTAWLKAMESKQPDGNYYVHRGVCPTCMKKLAAEYEQALGI